MKDGGRRGETSTIGAVSRFILAGLLAAVVISGGAYWVVSRNAVGEAIRNAQEIAAIDGRDIAAPALSDAVVAGDPVALGRYDQVIRERVLSARVVRVKIWSLEGRIVYSDVPALIGQVFALRPDELAAMRSNRIAAEVSELNRPENEFERAYGRLLEVYLPIQSEGGATFLFETYQIYSSIDQDQQRIWSAFFPVLLGGLVLLLAVQIPLAWGLASSLKRAQRDREALLERSLDVSAAERRRIARDLHDGVVQALAGVAYSLGAGSGRNGRRQATEGTETMAEAATVIRQAVRDLRTLIVDIAPPDLAGERLEAALGDLLAPLSVEGIETRLRAEGLGTVDGERAAVIYRAAQEAIRNAAAHSGATRLEVTVVGQPGAAELEVQDNGRGFTSDEVLSRRRDGHVGIGLLKGLVEDAGGQLSITSRPGAGTTLRIVLPEVAE